jgi:hypothetical protein
MYVSIENDGDLVEVVLGNIGSPEALITHFSLSLRNPFLQSRLLALASLTYFGKQCVSLSVRLKSTPFFLSDFTQTEALASQGTDNDFLGERNRTWKEQIFGRPGPRPCSGR